jgi:hypothetical protein
VVLKSTEEPFKEQSDPTEAQETRGPTDEGDGTASIQEQDAAAEGDEGAEQAGNDQEQYGDAANGGFQQNMMFPGGDFNQMQMMMAMQNGMGPNSFGGFPMMGKAPLAWISPFEILSSH